MKTIVTFSLILAFSSLFMNQTFSQDVGKAAPDFSLETLSDGTYKLADKQGKVVVIFFLGNQCPFCVSAAPKLQSDIYDKYSSRNDFSMIGIDTWAQSSSRLPGFKTQTNVSFPLAKDGSSVASDYGLSYDKLAVIDKDGILVHKTSSGGAGNDVANATEKINTALAKMATSIENEISKNGVALSQNYPNPVEGITSILYSLQQPSLVNLSVYDVTGKVVENIVSKQQGIGEYEVIFDASNTKSGVYYYQLRANDVVVTKRMLVR